MNPDRTPLPLRPRNWRAQLSFWMLVPTMFISFPAFGQIASSLLNPLVAAWIRSSVQGVDNLRVQITGSDQAILGGTIQQAQVSGDNISYQGFRVSQMQLDGQNIRLNINDAVQGRSKLKLLAPVPVQVSLRLTEADLNQTLQDPEIRSQLAQAKVNLPIGSNQSVPFVINDPKVKLETNRMRIQANLSTPEGTKVPVTLTTGLKAHERNQLMLTDPNWISNGQSIPIPGLNNLIIQLDNDVVINRLELQAGQILYDGKLVIQPDELSAPPKG